MITQVLIDAGRSALRPTKDRKWRIDLDIFCRRFKESWLYSNDEPPTENFHASSGSFIFLLHKNLGVTNAGLLELVSLLRIHTKHLRDEQIKQFDFFSDDQFTRFFTFLWASVVPPKPLDTEKEAIECIRKTVADFSSKYSYIFETTIVMNSYYTSAIVHIPRSLRTDVRSIVFESGYIHSAGVALYVRNIEKANEDQLLSRLDAFLSREPEHPIFATPYADEFFAPHEKNAILSVRNGLDGIRLQLRKHYIGGNPLVDFLGTLSKRLDGRVVVPSGFRPFAEERKESKSGETGCTPKCTLWFITDGSVVPGMPGEPARRGNEVYLFVYAQYYLNDNQFIAFKERKPGWYASVTLPHTLSIATINIARRHVKVDRPVILDPFCGGGTTLIDSALRMPNAVVIGLDKEPLAIQAIMDNLYFFGRNQQQITRIIDHIEPILAMLEPASHAEVPPYEQIERTVRQGIGEILGDDVASLPAKGRFILALQVIANEFAKVENALHPGQEKTNYIRHIVNNGFSHDFHEVMRNANVPFDIKILIYAIWRAIALGTFSLRGGGSDIYGVIRAELGRLTRELRHLIESLDDARIAGTKTLWKGGDTYPAGWFKEMFGLYSYAGIIDPTKVEELRSGAKEYKLGEFDGEAVSELQPGLHVGRVENSVAVVRRMRRSVDLIVTDPPYGFNTSEGGTGPLRQLFVDFVPAAIDALKASGQLLLVLPAFARNGRQIPFFETQGMLVREIVAAGARAGRSFKQIVETVPGDRRLYEFPVYWRSTSVLERRIIRFTIE